MVAPQRISGFPVAVRSGELKQAASPVDSCSSCAMKCAIRSGFSETPHSSSTGGPCWGLREQVLLVSETETYGLKLKAL